VVVFAVFDAVVGGNGLIVDDLVVIVGVTSFVVDIDGVNCCCDNGVVSVAVALVVRV